MKIIDVAQGSPEWHALRAKCLTASEAPVMMNASKKMRRNELLHMKATGSAKEVSDWVQKNLFDKGHELEAKARVILEERIGEELYPATATDDDERLLASFDGLTMMENVVYEHKSWNKELAAAVRAGELDPEYYWQLEQQLVVSGAEYAIFVCSDGTEANFESMDYYPVPGRAQQLLAGWAQFEEDLANYVPKEAKVEATAKTIEQLPALAVQLVGEVKQSNLALYQNTALSFIRSINTDLKTDQDFADAEATVKFCDKAEKELELVKSQALSQTQTIAELFSTIDVLKEEMRKKRLELDKLVKARKEAIRIEIKNGAEEGFREHVATINKRIGPRVCLPTIEADFVGVMKGKRTIATLQDAADSELARVKIEANAIAEKIETNLKTLRELDAKYRSLFADANQLVLKPHEDFVNVVTLRCSEHDKAEADRLEQERERIRQEEQQRLQREQQEREEEERRQAAAAEAAAQAPAETVPEPTPNPAPAVDPAPTAETAKPVVTGFDPASGQDQTVYHTTAPATVGKRKSVATLVNMDALLGDIVDGVMPMDLVQIHPEAVQAFVDHHGFAPTGFTLSSAE
jgi:predicted phage-related endonuclease